MPNSPHVEAQVPFDHLFAGQRIKIFGFQYKRLHQGSPDYWEIDVLQWQRARRFPWIYYALPQITSIRQWRNALHLLTIVESSAMEGAITSSGAARSMRLRVSDLGNERIIYFRWGGFVRALFGCRVGWEPRTLQELEDALVDAKEAIPTLAELYIISLRPGAALRISSSWMPVDGEASFDFGLEE